MTPKQQRFVQEYLVDLSAKRAALSAGYSPKTAEQQGYQLLQKPSVQAAIAAAQVDRSKRTEITADRVLTELARVGFSDIRNLFDTNGNLRRLEDLDAGAAAAIASIKVVVRKVPGGDGNEVERVHEIRAWDKVGALTQMGRHLGLFVDRNESTVKVEGTLHVVDRPPRETREEWQARRDREMAAA